VEGVWEDRDLHLARFVEGCQALGLSTGPGPDPPPGLPGVWTLRWLRWKRDGREKTLGVLTPGSLLPPADPLIVVGLVGLDLAPGPPRPWIKSLALFKRLALKARLLAERGWDDYIVVDAKGVLEGSNWAVLALLGDSWALPRLRLGLLRSTHAERLLAAGMFAGLPVRTRDITLAELQGATKLRGISSSGVRRLALATDALAIWAPKKG
ncbi:aminotransferase class IV, partial [bacterium]|nr:aminotransferase class IV [bacterium]